MGIPPNRIDIINEIEGVTFDEAWPRHVEFEYGGIRGVPLISVEDLVRNKEAVGRDKDVADVKALRKRHRR